MDGNAPLLRLRDYAEADREAVWALHNIALEATGVHGGNGPWDDDLKQIPAVYQEPGGAFLVGELAGESVAIGGLERVKDRRGEDDRPSPPAPLPILGEGSLNGTFLHRPGIVTV